MIGTVEIEIVIPETETADLRESPRERGISVRPPGIATADIPEDLPGTDMRERDTPEGDKGTALEKGEEKTLGTGDRNILEIGEGKIQGIEEEMIQEIGGRTNLKIGEGKIPGRGTERILEKEKILMRDNRITKLIPDERRLRMNLWKGGIKGWMKMSKSMINL